MTTEVPCSEYVKNELNRIKEAESHQTYDSVLRTVVAEYDVNGDE